MRVACLLVGIFVVAGLGCDDGLIEQLLRGRGGGDQGGPIAAPPPDAGAWRQRTDGATGGGGQGGSPGVACGPLSLSSTIVLAPAAAGQNYVRCQTLGPETGWQVALSPAGDRLAARTGAGTLRLLATDTWTEIAQLGSPLGAIDAVAFSPDGATLATLSAEMGEVALWSAHDGTLQRSFAGPAASGVDTTASALAFSSDGGRLATSLGTVIDLASGATTSWLTGAPQTFTLATNPENLGFSAAGGGIPLIRFVAGNARLFVETDFQIGNSPTSTRLELRDPTTGAAVVLYNFYSRGLLGYAVSPDGRTVARATTAEAAAQGFAAGLALFDATSGTQLASDPNFAGTVLGFSRDGAQLFIETGTTVSAVGASDLHPISQFTAPAGVTFLGVSPGERAGRLGVGDDLLVEPGHGRDRQDLELFARRRDLVGGWSLRRRHRRSGRAVSLLARVRRRAALWAAGRPHQRAGAGVAGDARTGRRESDRDVERRHVERLLGVRHPHPRGELRCAQRERDRDRRAAAPVRRHGRDPAERDLEPLGRSPVHLPGRRRRGLVPLGSPVRVRRRWPRPSRSRWRSAPPRSRGRCSPSCRAVSW